VTAGYQNGHVVRCRALTRPSLVCGGRIGIELLLMTRDYRFGRFIPAHHLTGSPRFVRHHDRGDARQAQFNRALERFAAPEMIVQVGVVEIDVLAARLLVFREHFAVFVAGDPTRVGELQRPAVAPNQMIDRHSVALGT